MKKMKHKKERGFTKFKQKVRPQFPVPINLRLEQLNESLIGSLASLRGIVDSVAQTSGPTLFSITDGTGAFILKGFQSPGERAYSQINEGDAVSAIVKVNEFNNSLEGEITRLQKLDSVSTIELKKQIENTERERSKPQHTEFLIESQILDKLKDSFIKAATEIKLAIIQNRPIIIRHHNDADGYSSGFALERAILPLIEKHHGPGKAAWEFYTRAPCAAPFYEIDDSIKDTSTSLRNVAKFSNKMPLVIVTDNGSTEQDLFAIQQGKIHGMQFIVVDHHFFGKDVISPEVLVHINPFLVGESGEKYSAGMLCTELARFINPVENVIPIAAMAGLADRIDNPEAMRNYLKLAEEQGYTKQLLMDIATVIDFVSAKLRFMEAREYIEVVFGEPREKQKELVHLMAPFIRKLEAKGLAIAKANAKIEKLGKTQLQYIFIEESFPGFGFYPKPGKAIGMLHDDLQSSKSISRLVTAGIMSSAITLRATDTANFSVHDFLAFVNKKHPDAFPEGGGHKNAGSINFVPSKQQEIFRYLKEFVSSLP